MAEYFYGAISIPASFASREDIQKLFDAQPWTEKWEHDGIVHFGDPEARYGHFEDLELQLEKLGVPFDVYSSSYDDFPEEIHYFRPDDPTRPHIYLRTMNREPIVPAPLLQSLLDLEPDLLKQQLSTLLSRFNPPVKPLSTYQMSDLNIPGPNPRKSIESVAGAWKGHEELREELEQEWDD